MTDTVKVLVWGTAEHGACAYFRGHLYDEPLKALGVEMRHLSKVDFRPAGAFEHQHADNDEARSCRRCLEAYRSGYMEVDKSMIEWADVVMFRRYYNTSYKCAMDAHDLLSPCKFRTTDLATARAHEHGFAAQDGITRMIWPAFRDHWTGGIVYETDDDHWSIQPWNGYYNDVLMERDLIREMTLRADIVTVSTPYLTQSYGKYNDNIRVIRNAIDPDLYVKDTPHPGGDKPRLVYYGSTARIRDYAGEMDNHTRKWIGGYARQAVDAHADRLTRVFLGTNGGTERIVAEMFDEQTPYIENIPEFSRALANSHGDIGIAPLAGDDFDRAKSELHWLEYAITDMAFIGQRFNGSYGPYNVIRPGVDGLLARGAQEWHDAVKALTKSKDLRAEIAGRAKERVLAEYDYRMRAQEWADVFRWAAEHPGYGAMRKAA